MNTVQEWQERCEELAALVATSYPANITLPEEWVSGLGLADSDERKVALRRARAKRIGIKVPMTIDEFCALREGNTIWTATIFDEMVLSTVTHPAVRVGGGEWRLRVERPRLPNLSISSARLPRCYRQP